MARLTVILMLAWTLLLLPALCTGGWLLHPCDCGSTIGCEHEEDCPSDPCETGLARPDSRSQGYDEGSASTASSSIVIEHFAKTLEPDASGRRISTYRLAFQDGLPFPPSDLPLLI